MTCRDVCDLPPLLQYSSVSLQGRTAEEAYMEMMKPLETVTLRVQHRLEEFNIRRGSPGDGFYIRYTWSPSYLSFIPLVPDTPSTSLNKLGFIRFSQTTLVHEPE